MQPPSNAPPTPIEGLSAACVRCGAPQAVVLDGRLAPCVYCRAPDPLDAATRARVHSAAGAISRIASREQRRLLSHENSVSELAWEVPVLAIPCWGIFGGIALLVVNMEKPSGLSFARFLLSGVSNHASKGAISSWWVLFFGILGLALTLVSYLFILWRIRGAVQPPPSMGPLSSGGPARCHLCGAGLPGAEVRRVCRSCGAANLVDDAKFEASATDLAAHVQHLHALDQQGTVQLSTWSGRVLYSAAFFPILLLVGIPFGWFAPGASPKLLLLPGMIAALAVPLTILLLVQSTPSTLAIGDVPPGGSLRIRGVLHNVVAILDVDMTRVRTQCGLLHLVAPEGSASPTLAFTVLTSSGGTSVPAFLVTEGGPALGSGQNDPSKLSAVKIRESSGIVEAMAPVGEEVIRIFSTTAPAPGVAPRWTLTATQLEADDVLILPPT